MARSIKELNPISRRRLNRSLLKSSSSRLLNRRPNGSQLAEMGPGLLILVIMTFFPLMLLIAIGVTYGAGYTLNDLQLREAAVVPKYEAIAADGNVKKNIPQTWKTMGLGQYTSLVSFPETTVTYKKGLVDGADRQDWKVIVTTRIKAKPFVSMAVPFLPNVPGLSAPMDFLYSGERMVESQEDAEKESPDANSSPALAPPAPSPPQSTPPPVSPPQPSTPNPSTNTPNPSGPNPFNPPAGPNSPNQR